MFESGEVDVWGLSFDAILDIVDRHPGLAAAYMAGGGDRTARLVQAIKDAGLAAIADVIDLGTRSEPGTTAALVASGDMVAIDQAEILFAVVQKTAPDARVGKLVAQGEGYADALGLAPAPKA